MAKLLRAHGLTFTDNIRQAILAKKKRNEEDTETVWNTAALFQVETTDDFHMFVQVLDHGGGEEEGYPALIGVVDADADLSVTDMERHGGAFLNMSAGHAAMCLACHTLYRSHDEDQDVKLCLPGCKHCDGASDSEVVVRGMHMYYTAEDMRLSFAVEGFPKVEFRLDNLIRDARPCIVIGRPGVILNVSVDSRRQKRPEASEGDSGASMKVRKTMWEDRVFTDAVVVCGASSFPVHRSLLAATSQFFAKAFSSTMREGLDAKVVIDDAKHECVEAVLQYLYKGTVSSNVDSIALLPLAHRLEVTGLVEHCSEEIVGNVSTSNAAQTVAALRPFSSDACVRTHWKSLLRRLREDDELLEASLGVSS